MMRKTEKAVKFEKITGLIGQFENFVRKICWSPSNSEKPLKFIKYPKSQLNLK